jgi:rhamnogalacturonan endolyase
LKPLISALGFLLIASTGFAQVTVKDDPTSANLNDGIIAARLDKQTGRIVSMTFDDVELLAAGSRGIWWTPEFDGTGNPVFRLVDDPEKNGGRRAEVAVKSKFAAADVEVHYALNISCNTALYAWMVLDHPAAYPDLRIKEGRIELKPNPEVFDHPVAGASRMADAPAYGWAGGKRAFGIWMINPGNEYLGGPAALVDAERDAAPILLHTWHGRQELVVPSGVAWKEIVGPFMIYVNAGGGPDGLWKDALAQAADERKAWPYMWLSDPEYPRAAERGSVSGRLVLSAPPSPGLNISTAWVGLAAPLFTTYQYWVRPDASGRFEIRAVRPGTYTLCATFDGVPGQYSREGVTVKAGDSRDVGEVVWPPARPGTAK